MPRNFLIIKKRALDFLTCLLCNDMHGQFWCTIQHGIVVSLCCNWRSWWNIQGLGTYCFSVIHYLVLTPSQTQRCRYCHYNAPSSQGLILYFTVQGKKTHFLHHVSVSHKQLLVSLCNLPVPQPWGLLFSFAFVRAEHGSLGGQAYIDVVMVTHNHLEMRQDSNYGMSCTTIVSKRAWPSSLW